MKKLFFVLGAAMLLTATSARATIQRQQSKANFTGSGTACAATFTNPPQVNDLIVVWATWVFTTASTASVVDTIGNTYMTAVAQNTVSTSNSMIFYAVNATAAADTVTVTFSVSTSTCGVVVVEYSGIATPTPLDVTSATTSATAGTGANLDSGSATPTFVNELVFGAATALAGSLIAGGGASTIQNNGGLLAEDSWFVSGAAQHATASIPSGTSVNWIMQMATFEEATPAAADSWNGTFVPTTLNSAIEVGGASFPATGAGLQSAINYTATLFGASAGTPGYGAKVILPCGSITLSTTVTIDAPILLEGCNGSVAGNAPGTKLVWRGGATPAIDVCPSAADPNGRGVVLRDFLLENEGTGTIGIRINCNGEPKLENIYVWTYDSIATAFSTAGVVVGDIALGLVNDFLCRDCYIRGQSDGLQLLNVSEATVDHSRIIFNSCSPGNCVAIRLGDMTHDCKNIQIIDGTAVDTTTTAPAILVTHVDNIINIDNLYCETTYANSGQSAGYCIDATSTDFTAPLLNLIGDYFAYTGGNSGSASYAVGVSGSGFAPVRVNFIGNTCVSFAMNCLYDATASSPQIADINNYPITPGGSFSMVNTTHDVVSLYGSSIAPNVINALSNVNAYTHLNQSPAGSNNFAGVGTIMGTGHTTVTLTPGYISNPPACTATDTSAINPVQVTTTLSSVTIYGTVGDGFSYICIGAPN